MEKFPGTPEKKEKEPITDEQCVEAMKSGDVELVREWYAEQEKIANQDPTIEGHTALIKKQAELQLAAGLKDDALETLDDAHFDAMNQSDFTTAAFFEDIIDEIKKLGSTS